MCVQSVRCHFGRLKRWTWSGGEEGIHHTHWSSHSIQYSIQFFFFFWAGQPWKGVKDMNSWRRKEKGEEKREYIQIQKNKHPQFVPINKKWQVCLCLVCTINIRFFLKCKTHQQFNRFYQCVTARLLNTQHQTPLCLWHCHYVLHFTVVSSPGWYYWSQVGLVFEEE